MTKLEEEIFSKLKRVKSSNAFKGATQGNITIEQSRAAAEVAKKYIEGALISGMALGEISAEEDKTIEWCIEKQNQWLKENGVTE